MIRPRSKPRRGRLKGVDLSALGLACWHRDDGHCRECGILTLWDAPQESDRSYHMAHIKAKRIGGDSLGNVRTLCGECHRKEHNYGKSMTKPVPCKVGEQ